MRRILLLGALAGLIISAPATAASTNAPPGNAGLTQYLETVPSSSGNSPSKQGSKRKVLSAKARADLAQQGSLGRSLSKFASGTGPDTQSKQSSHEQAPDGKIGALTAAATGSGSSGGMGLWLPILIVAVAALAVFAGYRQKSSRAQS